MITWNNLPLEIGDTKNPHFVVYFSVNQEFYILDEIFVFSKQNFTFFVLTAYA